MFKLSKFRVSYNVTSNHIHTSIESLCTALQCTAQTAHRLTPTVAQVERIYFFCTPTNSAFTAPAMPDCVLLYHSD